MNVYSQSTIANTIDDIAWELANEAPGVAYDAQALLEDAGVPATPANVAALIAAVVSESIARIEAMREVAR